MNIQDKPARFAPPAAAPAAPIAPVAPSIAVRYAPYVLSIVRIMVGLLFFEHGLSRIFGWPSPLPPQPLFSLLWFAGAIELFAVFVVLGAFTRLLTFIMSGEMAFAYFIAHAPGNFYPIINRGDAAILYCFIFLYFAFAGGGPWSLEAWWRRRSG